MEHAGKQIIFAFGLIYADVDSESIARGSHPFRNFDIFGQDQHLRDDW